MKISSLCYIERDNKYLMLHRVSKENDENAGKWIGIGGKFEEGESPEDCVCREVLEETGLTLTSYRYRGIVTFISNVWGTEYMHLFTSDAYTGEIKDCDEGVLEWIDKKKLSQLTLWEGDRIFLQLIDSDRPFFSLKLCYTDDTLTSAVLDGKTII
ncbi:MAG: 8-oxo-dGTP diphosphatase [Clostridia bacterium]|nr:8-oxo-dGTP diphosphatase [Clostridia bacterium]